ncbi:MAG: Ig-like domain-containing protein [Muribaculaceae bacterium]|nr:Ig-like domain-containing protein [Muribaculaceae bacterium]
MKCKHTGAWCAITIFTIILLMTACANIGTPTGGPRDETPPMLVKADPAPGALNVTNKKMTLTFNELVNVKDAFQNVVVSPTSKSVPKVTSMGRRVIIDFDSLSPNTTYTVDFGNSIEDVNEANKLQGFSYTFSTGTTLDSLRISGRVLSARNLEPQQQMIVGVQSNLADSAFTSQRLLRVAKTDDRGRFTIRGLAPGKYRVFALGDNDNDLKYSSPEEAIAFYDAIVEPSSKPAEAFDTIYNEHTHEIDTIIPRGRTMFLPNDILLRTFTSDVRQQYMKKYERLDSTRVFIKFNTKAEALPDIRLLGYPEVTNIGTLETRKDLDSLVYWLPPGLASIDTLRLEVGYTRTDPTLKPEYVTDTLNFITHKLPVRKNQKKKIDSKQAAADSLTRITTRFTPLFSSTQEVYLPIEFELPAPIARLDSGAFSILQKVDTIYRALPGGYRLSMPDSLNTRKLRIEYPWAYDTEYQLKIDSLAATDIYGRTSMPLLQDFATRKEADYSSLEFNVTGLPAGMPAFVELLGQSDDVKRTVEVAGDGRAWFPYLTPGKYYARIILDANGNGVYDTGDYTQSLQPELAYYYPKAINVRQNWDKAEPWNLFGVPVDQMKPMAILKNKPQQDRHNRNNNSGTDEDSDEEEVFDPTKNPFDPNDKGNRRNRTVGGY